MILSTISIITKTIGIIVKLLYKFKNDKPTKKYTFYFYELFSNIMLIKMGQLMPDNNNNIFSPTTHKNINKKINNIQK